MDETDLTIAHSYRMNKIEVIQNEMEMEQETRQTLLNKYKKRRATIKIIQNVLIVGTMGFGATSLGTFSTVVGIPISIIMDIGAVTAGILLITSNRLNRYFKTKIEKHNKIKMLAEAKLANISSYISKALEDDEISDEEYSLVLSEYKEYNMMREEIRQKMNHETEANVNTEHYS